jgi:hypothetical protein
MFLHFTSARITKWESEAEARYCILAMKCVERLKMRHYSSNRNGLPIVEVEVVVSEVENSETFRKHWKPAESRGGIDPVSCSKKKKYRIKCFAIQPPMSLKSMFPVVTDRC